MSFEFFGNTFIEIANKSSFHSQINELVLREMKYPFVSFHLRYMLLEPDGRREAFNELRKELDGKSDPALMEHDDIDCFVCRFNLNDLSISNRFTYLSQKHEVWYERFFASNDFFSIKTFKTDDEMPLLEIKTISDNKYDLERIIDLVGRENEHIIKYVNGQHISYIYVDAFLYYNSVYYIQEEIIDILRDCFDVIFTPQSSTASSSIYQDMSDF